MMASSSSSSKANASTRGRPEERNARRRATHHPALLTNSDGSIICLCLMKDVSATGAKLELQTESDIPDEFTLLLSKYGNVRRKCTVSWRSKATVGVRFDDS
jgi:PilZ domain